MVESSSWESISGGGDISLQALKYGSKVLSPAGERRPSMVGGEAQIRVGNKSSRVVWDVGRDWASLGLLRAQQRATGLR